MSLCKSPVRVALEEMAQNTHLILAVEDSLSGIAPDWREFVDSDKSIPLDELNDSFGLPKSMIDDAKPSESEQRRIDDAGADPSKFMILYRDLVSRQRSLRSSYMQEVALVGQEDEQAARRKKDYTPMVYKAIRALAEAGVLRDIVKDIRAYEGPGN